MKQKYIRLECLFIILFSLFLIPLTAKASDDGCELIGIQTTGILKSYPGNQNTSFSKDNRIYLLQIENQVSTITVEEISENAKFTINGEEKESAVLDLNDYVAKITVSTNDASQKKNYYFVYQDEEGNIPLLSGTTPAQKQKATSMLSKWYSRNDDARHNMMKNAYWAVFESAATGVDMNGGYVFDPQKSTYNQATDWSRAIIQTVILGYNPYDFGETHMNLVEGLLKLKNSNGLFGGYANNEWALMALKVVGEEIPDSLIQYERTNGFYNSYSVDIRGWALAAAKNYVSDDDLLIGVLDLKDDQNENGLWGNQYTNGCILTGIVGSGVNLDYFSVNEKSLLDIIDEKSTISGDQDGFAKDMIIGLGDIINGSNVWQRYTLTSDKWDDLISIAETIDVNNEVLQLAKQNRGIQGKGEYYYSLYEEVAKIKTEYRVEIGFGSPTNMVEPIEGVNYVIKTSDNTTANPTHGWKKSFTLTSGKEQGNSFGYRCFVPDKDIDYSIYTYNYMKKQPCYYSKTDKYIKEAFAVLLVENNAVIQGEDKDLRTANSYVFSVGSIKLDVTKPSLLIGTSSSDLSDSNVADIKCTSDIDSILVKATDGENGSGICNILYQTDGENWVSVYDAEKDDNIDVDNVQGLFEKNVSIPIPETDSMQIKVIDIAGLETVSTVNFIKVPVLVKNPEKTVDKNTTSDYQIQVKLNGADLSNITIDDTALEDSNYSVDKENGIVSLNSSFINTLDSKEYQMILTFVKDSNVLEDTIIVNFKVIDNKAIADGVIAAINAIDPATANKEELKAVQSAYDSLTSEQKAIVDADATAVSNKKAIDDKLVEIEKAETDQIEADKVIAAIKAINPETASKEELKAVQNAYNALTSEQKAIVDADTAAASGKKAIDDKIAELDKAAENTTEVQPTTQQKPTTEATNNPTTQTKPSTQPTTQTKPATNTESKKAVKVGDVFKGTNNIYKISSISKKSPEVTFTGAKSKNVTKVTIPATVKYKGKTYKVTSIAANACKNYKKLKSVMIQKNVKSIGSKSFYGCKKLSKITIKSTGLKKVGSQSFKGIYKKAVIKVPAKKLSKYKKLLKGKGQKKTVTIKK